MSNHSNISVFAQVDALENIEAPLLCDLVTKHKEYFKKSGIELTDDNSSQDSFPYQKFSKAIREIEDSQDLLVETLFLVESISNAYSYTSVQEQLSRLEVKYKHAIDTYTKNNGIEETLSDIGRVLVFVFCEALDDLHDLAVFASSQHTKGFREYPILTADSDKENIESKELSLKQINFDIQSLKDKVSLHNSNITKVFNERNIKSLCFVHTYLSDKTNSIWFFIEYGGRFTQIDQYEKSGKSSKLKYQQLTRDIIIYDIDRQVLSVKAQSKWKEEMYRKFAGLVIGDSENWFEDTSVYTLKPLFSENLIDLLSCRNVNKDIAYVRLRALVCHINTSDGIVNQKIYKQSGNGLLRFWETVRKDYCAIASASFVFKFRGYKSAISATIHNNRGLNVVHAKFKTHIQQFFHRKGFEILHQPRVKLSMECDDTWEGLLTLLSQPEVTAQRIYSLCGKKLGSYIIQESIEETDDFKDEWIDADGICYKVIENNRTYCILNENETTEQALTQISPEFVEVYKFLPQDFLKRIAKVLVPYVKQDFSHCRDSSQCIRINSYYPHGVNCWIYAPDGTNQLELSPIFKNRVPERNADVVFGFTEEPPQQWRELSNKFQWVFVGDILEITDNHELSYKKLEEKPASIRDFIKPASFDENVNRRWPFVIAPDTSWESVHIQLLHGCRMKVKVGVEEKELDPKKLEMFQNTKNETGLNKKFSCLIHLLQLGKNKGLFKLEDLNKNQYYELAKCLSKYFGIQAPVCIKDDTTKKYKLNLATYKCELDLNGYDLTS